MIVGEEPATTRFAPPSVSAHAIKTKPLFHIHHLVTVVYPNSPFEIVVPKPGNDLPD